MKRYEEEIRVTNKVGLHARPATIFVQTARKFKSKIFVEKDGKRVNAKSLLELLALDICYGDNIKIIAEGEDSDIAIKELTRLVKSRLSKES